MKAIQIKFLGPTNNKGVRLKAWTEAGSMTIPRDYSMNADEQARFLASQYIVKQGWQNGIAGFGTLPNGDYVAVLGPLGKAA